MNAEIKIAEPKDVDEVTADNKCIKCVQSICCNSINQKIPTPKTREDFDHLIWQVSHENISIFKDSDGWFLHVYANCSHLLPNGICSIYENRPWVCREYTNDFCEYDVSIKDASELWFATHKKLEEYCRKKFKDWEERFEIYE